MLNCIFCKIIKGEIPSEKVFESDRVIAFKDLHPQAKTHLLFIHKSHSTNINDLMEHNEQDIVDIYKAIKDYTSSNSLSEDGFRIVTNLGANGGQTVFHTHFHVLGGEKLTGFGS